MTQVTFAFMTVVIYEKNTLCYDANMKSLGSIESGVLPTFRLFTGIQFAITALGVLTQELPFFQTRTRAITLMPIHLAEPGLVFLYLSIPALRRLLKSYYLPIGIAVAALGLIIEPYIFRNNISESFVSWLWRQVLFLGIPLYVVSWQYSMKQVIMFSAIAAGMNIILLSRIFGFYELISSSFFIILPIQLLLYLLIGFIVVRTMKIQREQWQQLERANIRLAQHASTVEQLTISRERNRLARELHDVLAHTLSGVAVELEGLRATMRRDPEQATALLDHSLRAIREGLIETRRSLQELRAKPLEDLGLALAIQTLAESFASRSDFQIDLDIDHDLGNYPVEIQQSLYRIAQEALANVADHAQAQSVRVRLKRERNQIRLIVQDDGCGFDLDDSENRNHYGLLGMRERAEMIGGALSIESRLGMGTQVSFSYGDGQ